MRTTIVRDSRGVLSLTAVLAAGLVAGCSDSTEPDQPSRAAAPRAPAALTQVRAGRGIDAEFTRLASQVPGFGGMYYDAAGRLKVYVKPQTGVATRAADVVGQLRSVGGAAVRERFRRTPSATTVTAKYDYLQLQGWKSRLGRIFTVKGVVYSDIDEAQNRLRIAVTPKTSTAAVERVLSSAGVPREAVLISRISPIRRLVTLRDRLRPAPGGVQIEFPIPSLGPGFVGICTLGFNAGSPDDPGTRFFVTASHCSDVQGGNQQTPYYQPVFEPNRPTADRIAFEFKDPDYGNPGGLCEIEGLQCRLSDALLARYNGSAAPQPGEIARTTFMLQRIGAIEIDPNSPRWTVVGELRFPFEGEIAHKVGRSSGWTAGPVIATCVDVGVRDTNIVQICQDIVLAGSRPGDSGAPVFQRFDVSSSDVLLTGLLWGGGTLDGAPIYVFSPMENIEFELGELTTSSGADDFAVAAPRR